MRNPVYLLWLDEINSESLAFLPSLSKLRSQGVDLSLKPLPLVEKGQCYYQTLTGMGPGKLGRFDKVRTEAYSVYANTGVPDGAWGCMLSDILHAYELAITSLEVTNRDDLNVLADGPFHFAQVHLLGAGQLPLSELDEIVQRFLELVPATAHILVLTDVWSPVSTALVNVNDFLKDRGFLEMDEPCCHASIIWNKTIAYGVGTGQIWVNLRGREPQGIVNPGNEYREVCDALIDELCTRWLDQQTKEPVIEQVLKKDEIYTGEYLFRAPDLVTIYRSGYAASAKAAMLDFDGRSVNPVKVPMRTERLADPYARLIANGPCLVNGLRRWARLIDIVPNVLYLLGLPIPQRIDGKVIADLFTQSYYARTPLQFIDDSKLSHEEEGLIVDRLRDLGYLE